MARKAPTFATLAPEYARLFNSATVSPDHASGVRATARKIAAGRDRYDAVAIATGVPWWVVGLIHAMEAGCSFSTHLHNGDPLTARTRQVPRGRPVTGEPPFSWFDSACDAIRYDGLDKVPEDDWTLERVCYELEKFNVTHSVRMVLDRFRSDR